MVLFHDGDVAGFLVACKPVKVRPHGMEGIEGHHGTVQVQGFQECGEMAGLVVLDVDLEVAQEAPAVLGDAEEVDPGAVGAAGSAGGPAVYRPPPEPVSGPRFCPLAGAPGPVA